MQHSFLYFWSARMRTPWRHIWYKKWNCSQRKTSRRVKGSCKDLRAYMEALLVLGADFICEYLRICRDWWKLKPLPLNCASTMNNDCWLIMYPIRYLLAGARQLGVALRVGPALLVNGTQQRQILSVTLHSREDSLPSNQVLGRQLGWQRLYSSSLFLFFCPLAVFALSLLS